MNWDFLAKKDWSTVSECQDVDQMVEIFTAFITEALDEITPFKTFSIRSHHKFGLSEISKELIIQRDRCRSKIKGAGPTEKQILFEKYKKLRNKVNSQIRKDNIYYNNERIKKADNENEIWKVAQEITNPKNSNEWTMKCGDGKSTINDEQIIADTFNTHFTEKIENLKKKTDEKITEDPLSKLKKRLENNTKIFDLKIVNEDSLRSAFKNIKKKKSSGSDGLTQSSWQ